MTTWRWCDSPKRIAAESGLELEKFEMVPTSPTASCREAGNGVFSYRDNGLTVLVDWYNRRILRAGLDLSSETLDGWYFNTRALQQCRKLKVTPGNVVESLADSDAFPAQSGRTLYRGLFDVLVHEGKNRVVSVGAAKSLNYKILRQPKSYGSGEPLWGLCLEMLMTCWTVRGGRVLRFLNRVLGITKFGSLGLRG